MLCAERTIQTNLYNADLSACSIQVLNGLIDGLTDGTHRNDNVLSIRSAVVVEQLVVGADLLVYLVHVLFYNSGECIVVRVACLASLEEDIRVLSRTSRGRDGSGSAHSCGMRLIASMIYHIFQVIVIPCFDLLHLMRGTEAIEEVAVTEPCP